MSGSKKIAILQPAYLPWLGYFDLLDAVDLFVDYDDVQFTRRDWRTRNRVLGPNGPCWLRVPTESRVGNISSRCSAINEIQIDSQSLWAEKHLCTLAQSYRKARYFSDYYPVLENLYRNPPRSLVELNCMLRDTFASWLGITTPVVLASSLQVEGRKEKRILALCTHLGADSYYSGAAARDYIHPEVFGDFGISIYFQDYQHPQYGQRGKSVYVSHLSVLDLLFNEGSASLAIIRQGRRYQP